MSDFKEINDEIHNTGSFQLPRSKRKIKQQYIKAEIGLSEAITELMFDHFMERNQALAYLGL